MIKTDVKYIDMKLSNISISKTNPRSNFEKQPLKDLMESIKERGVIQPILVRPQDNSDKHELVCGERRYRASIMAGLTVIPTVIRNLDDKEAYEVQIIENLQREDIHPLDEAGGYESLMKKFGVSGAEQISRKVGKSIAYVYNRMKLLSLNDFCREKFKKGELTASTAFLVARIPQDMQEKACKMITEGRYGEGAMTFKNAKCYIENDFMLSLIDAPFDVKDKNLSENCGACVDCPKKTGNDKLLFNDITEKNACTDPSCFKSKKHTSWANENREAKKKGYTILKADSGRNIFYNGKIQSYCAYVDIKDVCPTDKEGRKYKVLLKDLPSKDICTSKDDKGKIHHIVKKSVIKKFFEKSGMKKLVDKDERSSSPVDEEKRKINTIAEELTKERVINAIVEVVEKGKHQGWVLSFLVHYVTENSNYIYDVLEKRGIEREQSDEYLKKLEHPKVFGFLVDCILTENADYDNSQLLTSSKELGFDYKATFKEFLKEAKEIRKKEIEESNAEKE